MLVQSSYTPTPSNRTPLHSCVICWMPSRRESYPIRSAPNKSNHSTSTSPTRSHQTTPRAGDKHTLRSAARSKKANAQNRKIARASTVARTPTPRTRVKAHAINRTRCDLRSAVTTNKTRQRKPTSLPGMTTRHKNYFEEQRCGIDDACTHSTPPAPTLPIIARHLSLFHGCITRCSYRDTCIASSSGALLNSRHSKCNEHSRQTRTRCLHTAAYSRKS